LAFAFKEKLKGKAKNLKEMAPNQKTAHNDTGKYKKIKKSVHMT
jgi:hypothetical protein